MKTDHLRGGGLLRMLVAALLLIVISAAAGWRLGRPDPARSQHGGDPAQEIDARDGDDVGLEKTGRFVKLPWCGS